MRVGLIGSCLEKQYKTLSTQSAQSRRDRKENPQNKDFSSVISAALRTLR
jgi:hypothetical protein